MPCTSLCSIGGTLMRRTSPCTRIMGGRPEDRCRSDALFLTTKASSSVRSITILPGAETEISAEFQGIMKAIADNLQAVRERIGRAARAARRDAGAVALLAVSKTHPAARIAEAHAAGQQAFGENYVQEAIEKMAALPAALEWHLIGPLQSNKTRLAAERFQWGHTVE